MAEDLPVGSQPTLSIATAIKPPSFYQQPDQAQQAQQQAVSGIGAVAMAQPEPVARVQAQNSGGTGLTQPESEAAGSNRAAASRASRKSSNSSWQQADPVMEEMRRLLSPWRYVPCWESVHISCRIHWLLGPSHSGQQVPGMEDLGGCCCSREAYMPQCDGLRYIASGMAVGMCWCSGNLICFNACRALKLPKHGCSPPLSLVLKPMLLVVGRPLAVETCL